MTKSVSGQDVEDMLSSVRRLVSSELPRNRRTPLPEGPGALVLTDAQRIEPSMMGHNAPPKTLEDRIAELEAAVSETSDDWEPDGSEDQEQHRPDRIVYKSPDEDRRSDRRRSLRLSEIALIETGPANDEETETGGAGTATFRHDRDSADASYDEEELSDYVAALADADVPDISEVIGEDDKSQIAEPSSNARLGDDQHLDDENPSFERDADSPPDEYPSEYSETGAEIDPSDGEVEEINADEAFEEALAEAVAASLPGAVADEIMQDTNETSVERVQELYGEPNAAEIDESSIRPLVAALIREELQGELGERITRNVRKLVRQEIQRALTVRELE